MLESKLFVQDGGHFGPCDRFLQGIVRRYRLTVGPKNGGQDLLGTNSALGDETGIRMKK